MPRPILLIDMWPDALAPGEVRDRFRDLPPTAQASGHRIESLHHSRVDPDALAADPPAAVIVSGSATNLVDDPAEDPVHGAPLSRFAAVTALLARLPRTPVLGICFGHQYLAKAAGGRLERMPGGKRNEPHWPIDPAERDPLFAGLPEQPVFVEAHEMRVAAPGEGYRVVATSADGIEMVRHAALPRVGVQFHPEYFARQEASRAHGRRFLDNWLRTLAP